MKQIGIDFGTSTTQISYMGEGLLPKFFAIGPNRLVTLPSVIAYQRGGETLYGAAADNATPSKDCIIFRSIKREIIRNGGQAIHDVFGVPMSVADIAHQFLSEAVRRAKRLGASAAERAVICCPTDANREYREFVCLGLRNGGFQAETLQDHVLEEPVLAAHVMRQLESFEDDNTVLIYDFGGGTFDSAIAKINTDLETGRRSVDLIYAAGDLELGGDNIDDAVLLYVVSKIAPNRRIEELTQAQKYLLLQACRNAKVRLSEEDSVSISLPSLGSFTSRSECDLSRRELNSLVAPYWERSVVVLNRLARAYYAVVGNAKSRKQSLEMFVDDAVADAIICVGGTTRIPYICKQLEALFGPSRVREYDMIPPELAVAAGAALMDENITSTSVRQTAYACSLMMFDRVHSLIGEPVLLRKAYSPIVSLNSTIVGGLPGVQHVVDIPTNVKKIVLLFSHSDQPLPGKAIKWDELDDDVPCVNNDSWASRIAVFIGANGIVEMNLNNGPTQRWNAPWVGVGKSAEMMKMELDAFKKQQGISDGTKYAPTSSFHGDRDEK